MQRRKRRIIVLSSLFLLASAVAQRAETSGFDAAGTPRDGIDHVVLTHPGYTITVFIDGHAQVDFVLNQQRIPRNEIDAQYRFYPREWTRRATVERRQSDDLFALVRSPEFAAVGPEYLAPPGTFAYAGHRVIMTLTVYAGPALARRVTFDSSREADWPSPLRRVFDEMIGLAQATGPLPVGPFIR